MKNTLKKVISLLLMLSIVTALAGATASADSVYSVENGMITGYMGKDADIVVPSEINGEQIIGIARNAFEGAGVSRVELSEGIEVINADAFKDCANLTEVILPSSILLICDYAFVGCYKLEEPKITGKEVFVGDYAFDTERPEVVRVRTRGTPADFTMVGGTITLYSGSDTVLEIPSQINDVTVTAIGANAFKDNTTLTSVTIPDTITNIDEYAFYGCSSLTSVTLPSNLVSIGQYSFSQCAALTEITVPGTVRNWGYHVFDGDTNIETAVFGEGLLRIGAYAFYGCNGLTSVSLPSTLKTIDIWAFGFCIILPTIDLVNGITEIGNAAFYYCRNLNDIIVPNTVTVLRSHVFRPCTKLTNLTLPNTLTTIEYRALNGCGFTTLSIPQSVTAINGEVFYQCPNLTHLDLPKNLEEIGDNCFYSCGKLEWVKMYSAVDSIGTTPFQYCTKLKLYVVEGSYAESFAETNSISYDVMLANTRGYSQEDSIGVLTQINIPDFVNYGYFGVRYIPKTLYGGSNYVTVAYDISNLEASSVTFFTQLDEIPDRAADWEFAITPFLSGDGMPDIFGKTKVISISNTSLRDYE